MESNYIRVFAREHTRFIEFHKHENIELVYIIEGNGILDYPDQSFMVQVGDFLLYNANTLHRLNAIDHLVAINVTLQPGFLDPKLKNTRESEAIIALSYFNTGIQGFDPIIHFEGKEHQKMRDLFLSIFDEYSYKRPGYLKALRGYLNVIFTLLIRKMMDAPNLDFREISDKMNPKIIDFINHHYNQKVSLSDLASYAFYNPSYFGQVFKSCYGITPIEYVTNIRINNAALLLKQTNKTIESIMLEVGIKDKKQFYEAFKQVFHMTPGLYRKSNTSLLHNLD